MPLLSVIDAYAIGRKAGIPRTIFENIFQVCISCDAHMTRDVAGYHCCDAGSDYEQSLEM